MIFVIKTSKGLLEKLIQFVQDFLPKHYSLHMPGTGVNHDHLFGRRAPAEDRKDPINVTLISKLNVTLIS